MCGQKNARRASLQNEAEREGFQSATLIVVARSPALRFVLPVRNGRLPAALLSRLGRGPVVLLSQRPHEGLGIGHVVEPVGLSWHRSRVRNRPELIDSGDLADVFLVIGSVAQAWPGTPRSRGWRSDLVRLRDSLPKWRPTSVPCHGRGQRARKPAGHGEAQPDSCGQINLNELYSSIIHPIWNWNKRRRMPFWAYEAPTPAAKIAMQRRRWASSSARSGQA